MGVSLRATHLFGPVARHKMILTQTIVCLRRIVRGVDSLAMSQQLRTLIITFATYYAPSVQARPSPKWVIAR